MLCIQRREGRRISSLKNRPAGVIRQRQNTEVSYSVYRDKKAGEFHYLKTDLLESFDRDRILRCRMLCIQRREGRQVSSLKNKLAGVMHEDCVLDLDVGPIATGTRAFIGLVRY